MDELDEQARVLANAQHGEHALERDDEIRVKIRGFGCLERFVIAEKGEDIGRKATEAKVEVARFACCILSRKGITEHVHLSCQGGERGVIRSTMPK